MNSNNRNSMFPFRRGGGKKRGKPGGGGNAGGRRQGGQGGGRRIPNSAQELLGVLQPTTKSLAQVLAGNTRASGQIVHARNVLGQAERLVDERAIDRLPPAQREEFFEQVARLKLTLADAEREAEVEAETEVAEPVAPMSMDRLRALALSIATGGPAPGEPARDEPPSDPTTEATPAEPGAAEAAAAEPVGANADDDAEATPAEPADKPTRPKRANTLRLKTLRHDPAEADELRRPEPAR
ncbi:MAG: hypothetical protein H6852_05105 [Geminicoccaceae bacterium]|nr:hypothetical protein [Geminicoccaceae bacterium]HRY23983.1 hypothetical protein [Geminicoccaceae bacterium]